MPNRIKRNTSRPSRMIIGMRKSTPTKAVIVKKVARSTVTKSPPAKGSSKARSATSRSKPRAATASARGRHVSSISEVLDDIRVQGKELSADIDKLMARFG